ADGRGVGRSDALGGVVAVRNLELGGEGVGPVAEHLADVALDRLGVDVPARAQGQAAGGGAFRTDLALLQVAVAHAGAVVVADVPVQLQRVLFELGVAVALQGTGIEAIGLGDALGLGDVGRVEVGG